MHLERAADEGVQLAALRESCDAPMHVAHALDVYPAAADDEDAVDGDRLVSETPEPDRLRASPCVTWGHCLSRGAGGSCTSWQNCYTSLRDFEVGTCHVNCVDCVESPLPC